MKTQIASNLRHAILLALVVLLTAFSAPAAFAQTDSMERPLRTPGACWMPIRSLESGAETSLARGNSGEFLSFADPFFKAGFGLYELTPGDHYFGFKGETTGNSRVKGYSRNVEVVAGCNTLRRITIKCTECDFWTGDQTGGFLNVRGLEVVRTFERRSAGWAMICDVTDRFKADYFGLSKWPDATDSSNRVGFSVHDGGIWQKYPTNSDEFRKSDLHCPIQLNTGTVVELDLAGTVLDGNEVWYSVFRIRNDASTTNRPGDIADWFAFWDRMW